LWQVAGGGAPLVTRRCMTRALLIRHDADTTDGVCAAIAGDASSCTLRAAIDEANAQLSDDVIQLTAGMSAAARCRGRSHSAC
jgi:CSLREA domain-containing protein